MWMDVLQPRLSDRRSFTRLSPKLGLVWRLSPARSLYASVGGGVEAPAGNETDPVSTFGQDTVHGINPLLHPIRSTTYEVGAKALDARAEPASCARSATTWRCTGRRCATRSCPTAAGASTSARGPCAGAARSWACAW